MPRVKAAQIELHVETTGDGPPLLLIQGLGYDARAWEWLLPHLEPAFRVLRFDNRGVGLSDAPPGPYSIPQLADDTAALLEAIGIDRAHVLGVSMGGYVAQELALRHPGRVDRLILGCTCFTGNPERIDMPQETLEVLTDRSGAPEELFARGIRVAMAPSYAAAHPEIVARFLELRLERPVAPEAFAAQFQGAVGFDAEDRVGTIARPTLVVHGSLDAVVPAARGRELAAAIPGARLEILEGAGHLFFIERAAETAALLGAFCGAEGGGG